MAYVDGFVIPVPRRKVAAYVRMARKASKIWRKHGATAFVETVADDVKKGKRTSFPRSVKLKRGETVVLSWVVFKSRAHRDRVNDAVMKDKRFAPLMNDKNPPFDMRRMFWGGFKVLLDE